MSDHPNPPPEPQVPEAVPALTPVNRVAEAILQFLGQVPETEEPESDDPHRKARAIAHAASTRAGMAAATLALPPGPIGWITIVPELITVWKVQAQMIADIAAVFGRHSHLSREQMIYCLFRHMAAQAMRTLVVQAGERVLFRRVSLRAFQGIAEKIGIRVTQRAISKGISRWVPLIGAAGVGAYAYYDTRQVAKTTIALFEKEIEVISVEEAERLPEAEE